MFKSTLFATLLFAAFLSLNAQTTWNLLNPKPSYFPGLDLHFVSAQTGYIINASEILETADAGLTWSKKQNISSGVDMDFHNAVGYIVGYNNYVLRTLDNGLSWSAVYTGISDNYNTVSIADNNHIFISSPGRLIKSSDGGLSWQQSIIPNSYVIKTLFVDSLTGHAVCQDGKILKTVDAGVSWYTTVSTNTIPAAYFTIYFIDKNTGFATHEFHTLLKTIDGGETWTEIPGSFEAIYDFHFVNNTTGYACGEYGALYKTTDGGNTWNSINFQMGLYDASSMFGIYFTDENNGYATGVRGRIVKTTNGGNSWSQYAPTYNTIKQIAFPTNTVGYALVSDDYFKSTDAGNTWSYAGTPLHYDYANGFDFVDANIGYSIGGGISSSVYKTSNGGSTWVQMNNGMDLTSDGLTSIDFVNESIGYVSAVYNDHKTLKTTDGGNTWQELNTWGFGQIQFLNPLVGYARNAWITGNRIFKTIDGGITWDIAFEIGEDIKSFHFINENVGYFVGDDALAYKTSDGGTSWQHLSIPYGYYTLVKFYSEDQGYASDDDGHLYKTTDGGANWELIHSIYEITDITFQDSTIYLSGTYGKILSSDLRTVGVHDLSTNSAEIQIYPNPATDKINITCGGENTIKSVTISDFMGIEILYSNNTNHLNQVEIDLSNKNSGMYIVKTTLDSNERITQKIIIH